MYQPYFSVKQQFRNAFTLIELSIVLVIIGLIIGGVLVGKNLVEAAERRKLVSQVESIKTATNTFRLKYNCLPGDCTHVTRFFGSAGGNGLISNNTCSLNATTNKGATGTCNGDGNGKISVEGMGSDYERYSMWQHLALAGFIEGEYEVRGQGISYGHKRDVNVPSAEYKKGMISLALVENNIIFGRTYSLGLIGKHALLYGISNISADGTYWGAAAPNLTPTEAKQIDMKFDDGIAYSGNITGIVQTGASGNRGCTSPIMPLDEYDPTADYNMSASYANAIKCLLAFEYLN